MTSPTAALGCISTFVQPTEKNEQKNEISRAFCSLAEWFETKVFPSPPSFPITSFVSCSIPLSTNRKTRTNLVKQLEYINEKFTNSKDWLNNTIVFGVLPYSETSISKILEALKTFNPQAFFSGECALKILGKDYVHSVLTLWDVPAPLIAETLSEISLFKEAPSDFLTLYIEVDELPSKESLPGTHGAVSSWKELYLYGTKIFSTTVKDFDHQSKLSITIRQKEKGPKDLRLPIGCTQDISLTACQGGYPNDIVKAFLNTLKIPFPITPPVPLRKEWTDEVEDAVRSPRCDHALLPHQELVTGNLKTALRHLLFLKQKDPVAAFALSLQLCISLKEVMPKCEHIWNEFFPLIPDLKFESPCILADMYTLFKVYRCSFTTVISWVEASLVCAQAMGSDLVHEEKEGSFRICCHRDLWLSFPNPRKEWGCVQSLKDTKDTMPILQLMIGRIVDDSYFPTEMQITPVSAETLSSIQYAAVKLLEKSEFTFIHLGYCLYRYCTLIQGSSQGETDLYCCKLQPRFKQYLLEDYDYERIKTLENIDEDNAFYFDEPGELLEDNSMDESFLVSEIPTHIWKEVDKDDKSWPSPQTNAFNPIITKVNTSFKSEVKETLLRKVILDPENELDAQTIEEIGLFRARVKNNRKAYALHRIHAEERFQILYYTWKNSVRMPEVEADDHANKLLSLLLNYTTSFAFSSFSILLCELIDKFPASAQALVNQSHQKILELFSPKIARVPLPVHFVHFIITITPAMICKLEKNSFEWVNVLTANNLFPVGLKNCSTTSLMAIIRIIADRPIDEEIDIENDLKLLLQLAPIVKNHELSLEDTIDCLLALTKRLQEVPRSSQSTLCLTCIIELYNRLKGDKSPLIDRLYHGFLELFSKKIIFFPVITENLRNFLCHITPFMINKLAENTCAWINVIERHQQFPQAFSTCTQENLYKIAVNLLRTQRELNKDTEGKIKLLFPYITNTQYIAVIASKLVMCLHLKKSHHEWNFYWMTKWIESKVKTTPENLRNLSSRLVRLMGANHEDVRWPTLWTSAFKAGFMEFREWEQVLENICSTHQKKKEFNKIFSLLSTEGLLDVPKGITLLEELFEKAIANDQRVKTLDELKYIWFLYIRCKTAADRSVDKLFQLVVNTTDNDFALEICRAINKRDLPGFSRYSKKWIDIWNKLNQKHKILFSETYKLLITDKKWLESILKQPSCNVVLKSIFFEMLIETHPDFSGKIWPIYTQISSILNFKEDEKFYENFVRVFTETAKKAPEKVLPVHIKTCIEIVTARCNPPSKNWLFKLYGLAVALVDIEKFPEHFNTLRKALYAYVLKNPAGIGEKHIGHHFLKYLLPTKPSKKTEDTKTANPLQVSNSSENPVNLENLSGLKNIFKILLLDLLKESTAFNEVKKDSLLYLTKDWSFNLTIEDIFVILNDIKSCKGDAYDCLLFILMKRLIELILNKQNAIEGMKEDQALVDKYMFIVLQKRVLGTSMNMVGIMSYSEAILEYYWYCIQISLHNQVFAPSIQELLDSKVILLIRARENESPILLFLKEHIKKLFELANESTSPPKENKLIGFAKNFHQIILKNILYLGQTSAKGYIKFVLSTIINCRIPKMHLNEVFLEGFDLIKETNCISYHRLKESERVEINELYYQAHLTLGLDPANTFLTDSNIDTIKLQSEPEYAEINKLNYLAHLVLGKDPAKTFFEASQIQHIRFLAYRIITNFRDRLSILFMNGAHPPEGEFIACLNVYCWLFDKFKILFTPLENYEGKFIKEIIDDVHLLFIHFDMAILLQNNPLTHKSYLTSLSELCSNHLQYEGKLRPLAREVEFVLPRLIIEKLFQIVKDEHDQMNLTFNAQFYPSVRTQNIAIANILGVFNTMRTWLEVEANYWSLDELQLQVQILEIISGLIPLLNTESASVTLIKTLFSEFAMRYSKAH